MERLQDTSVHHTTSKLICAFKALHDYNDLFKHVQEVVCSPNVDKNDFLNTLEEVLRTNGVETKIRNVVFHLVRNKLKVEDIQSVLPNDPLGYLKRAAIQWGRRVHKSLNAMCAELKMSSQGQPRMSTDRDEILSKWDELSNYNVDLTSFRPVYAPKDLLDVLLSLKGPSKRQETDEFVEIPNWEFSHIPLRVKNFSELRTHYSDLLCQDSSDLNIQYHKVLGMNHAPLCQYLLKKGNTPATFRGSLWSHVLNSHVDDCDINYWAKLRNTVLATEHIVDKLVFKDIELTASNDDQYFVFEDVLYQIMLCFLRDKQIDQIIHNEYNVYKGKTHEAPPSGVVPFHGICMYAAPFCYLFDLPIHLYFTFRAFYIRYCHPLTTINTHPQGIVSLCLLFEKLLQSHEPQLWLHFRELQIQPIRIVFKWLMRAFSGHLPPDQLLILWDLILGFDSLEILSLLAVIILSFRKESLLQVNSLDNIEAILADLSSIKVLPLIQLALGSG